MAMAAARADDMVKRGQHLRVVRGAQDRHHTNGPAHDPAEVCRLAPLAMIHPDATRAVSSILDLTEAQADAKILRLLRQVADGSYVETIVREFESGDPIHADVYGIQDGDQGWYLKIYIEHGQVVVRSCHLPLRPLACRDGRVVDRAN
ncbi:MAG: hypothetical protein IPM35_08050 [Myxococcales bacterium]|nr:hypothetical protein [Myxococcales bacterium]